MGHHQGSFAFAADNRHDHLIQDMLALHNHKSVAVIGAFNAQIDLVASVINFLIHGKGDQIRSRR